MNKIYEYIYIYILPIFLGCGIFGASSTGAFNQALSIVNNHLKTDQTYIDLKNKAETAKNELKEKVPNEKLRNMFLEHSKIEYPLRNLFKCQQKVSSYIYEMQEIKRSIDTFIKQNPAIENKLDKNLLFNQLHDNLLLNTHDKLQDKKKAISSIKESDIPLKPELIDRCLEILDQIIASRLSLDIAEREHKNYLNNKDEQKKLNELYDEIKRSMETNSIQLSFLESLSLSDAYYDAQKELNEYQRNLNTTFRIFK